MLHQRQAVHLHQQVCHPALQQTKWHHLMKLMRTETSVFLSALPLTIPTSLAFATNGHPGGEVEHLGGHPHGALCLQLLVLGSL